jgi:hypothetical protein
MGNGCVKVIEYKYDDGWWTNREGLVLSPNNLVPDCFNIGEEIEIIPEHEE